MRTCASGWKFYGLMTAVCATCLFSPLPVVAQTQQSSPLPVFQPVSDWTVGATSFSKVRGLSNVKMPCVLSNEYDNGFVVRFSGGGKKILAMAIDFRQDVFQKGRSYKAMVSLGGQYIKQVDATAFTAGTLLFNLRSMPDFYTQLSQHQTLGFAVEGNEFTVSTQGAAPALLRLETCYNGEKTPVIAPLVNGAGQSQSAAANPPPAVVSQPLPLTQDDKTAGTNITALPIDGPLKEAEKAVQDTYAAATTPVLPGAKKTSPVPLPRGPMISKAMDMGAPAEPKPLLPSETSPPIHNDAAGASWRAYAGEDIRSVVLRWADVAGYDLQWQAHDAGTVAKDVALTGSFEDAVAQLLADNAAVGNDLGIQVGGADSMPSVRMKTTTASGPLVPSALWQADAGTNMQTVVGLWAGRAGVDVVWDSFTSFPLKNSVSSGGTFEDAVQKLLDQYQGDVVRPYGELNTDPATGRKTLFMRVQK